MNFSVVFRYNPQTGRDERYFRLKESYRDATGAVRNRLVLTVGFEMNDIPMEEVRQVAVGLTDLWQSNGVWEDVFGDRLSCFSETVRRYIDRYWRQILEKKRLDIVKESIAAEHRKAGRLVDVYTSCELKSLRIMEENSAVCELLTGSQKWRPGYHAVYEVAPDLYKLKDKLEDHLCRRTDDLFNATNRIILFDLTNFYFEGRKEGSRKSRHGRSKEKRNDCKLLVLALCINQEGFIRYSSILAGNTADRDSLPD